MLTLFAAVELFPAFAISQCGEQSKCPDAVGDD